MDVLTKHIQDVVPKCVLFVDDIVLIRKSWEDVNGKLKMCREALESNAFHLNRNKIEYIECRFNKRQTNNNLKVKIEEHIIYQRCQVYDILDKLYKVMERLMGMSCTRFRLGGWNKQMSQESIMIIRYLISLKGKFCQMAIRPVMF